MTRKWGRAIVSQSPTSSGRLHFLKLLQLLQTASPTRNQVFKLRSHCCQHQGVYFLRGDKSLEVMISQDSCCVLCTCSVTDQTAIVQQEWFAFWSLEAAGKSLTRSKDLNVRMCGPQKRKAQVWVFSVSTALGPASRSCSSLPCSPVGLLSCAPQTLALSR